MITALLTDSAKQELSAFYDHTMEQVDGDLLTELKGWTQGTDIRTQWVADIKGGDFPQPTTRAGRTLTMSFMAERETRQELWDLDRKISGLFHDGGFGTLTVAEDDLILSAEVTLDGVASTEVNLLGGYIEASIPLHAPDPHLYAKGRLSYLHPVGTGIGLEYSLFSPNGVLSFGTAMDTDLIVVNNGNAVSYPELTVRGNFPGGFQLTAGKKTFTWPWPTTYTVPVRIEMSGRVWVGKQNVTNQASVRQWFEIPPRGILKPALHALQGGDGWVEVNQRDTYL